MTEPAPFEVLEPGVYLHGTKADLRPGDLLTPGHPSNHRPDRPLHHIYVTETLAAAAWGAQLAQGEGRERIYIVQPVGELEDDPNVTDQRFPGNPTRSYRTREPVRVVEELAQWTAHSPAHDPTLRQDLARLRQEGQNVILD